MNGEFESKIHDRVKELFGATWGNFALGVVWALVSVWLIIAGTTALRTDTTMLGPITWWMQQATDLGLTPPTWLTDFAAWRPQSSVDLMGWVLVVAAAALVTRRTAVPGFFLCAWILLAISCEWFSVWDTFLRFGLLSLLPVVAATALAVRQHLTRASRPQFYFTSDSIMAGFVSGPAAVLIVPIFMPVGLAVSVIRSYGFPDSLPAEDSPSVKVLESTLQEIAQHGGTLDEVPAATHARLLAAINLVNADDRSRREAVAMLRYRAPSPATSRRLRAATPARRLLP